MRRSDDLDTLPTQPIKNPHKPRIVVEELTEEQLRDIAAGGAGPGAPPKPPAGGGEAEPA